MRSTKLLLPALILAMSLGSSSAQTIDDTTFVPADTPSATAPASPGTDVPQDPAVEPPQVLTVTGKVVSVDAALGSLVVESEAGETTFSVAPEAIVFQGEQGGQLSDLRAGDPVTLTYSQEGLVNRVVRLEADRPRSPAVASTGALGVPPVILPTAIGLILLATAVMAIRSARRSHHQHVHI